eukprot:3416155-Ditylum_brightwellii.AAC.1
MVVFAQKLLVAATCLSSIALGLITTTPQLVTTKQKFHRAASDGAVILIDDSVSIWAKDYNLGGQVSLIVDHGSAPNGYWLKDQGISVIFAGQSMKADDVIVRDVPFCQKELLRDVIVVTADTELIQRCKRAAERSSSVGAKSLQVIDPNLFLQDMESVVGDTLANIEQEQRVEEEKQLEQSNDDKITSDMENEITLGARLIAVETQLKNSKKKKKNVSPKKRRKLEKQAGKIRAMLGLSGPSILHRATSIISNDGGVNEDDIDSLQQIDLLQKWESIRKSSGRREMTGDRVLLAEGLRRKLEKINGEDLSQSNVNFESMCPVEAHACYANALIHNDVSDVHVGLYPSLAESLARELPDFHAKDTLRLVVISDTHGYERALTDTDCLEPWLFINDTLKSAEEETNIDGIQTDLCVVKNSYLLPEGDILLHLGDFAVDRGGTARQNALDRFDRWLSLQPHPVKIVVRGNHDPAQVKFSLSQATYVTRPETMTFGNKTIAIVPYGSSGFSVSKATRSSCLIPSTCDILATHEPPHSILDSCLSGDRAGSRVIRSAVENMKGLPPKLWVCGHIHEGRGSMRHTFGTKHTTRETVVINAANANHGRANHLMHGPVVVDVSEKNGICGGKEQKPSLQKTISTERKREKNDNEEELLLAIDL